MSMIAESTATSMSEALAEHTDLPDAVQAAIDFLIANGKAFSSGEVAREIRMLTDIRFSVLTVGQMLREWFYANTMPSYDDGDGEPVYPCKVPRTTVGLFPDRTPEGQEVFVYAFDEEDGADHDFEVYIPVPGSKAGDPEPDPSDDVEDEPEPKLPAAPAGTAPASTAPAGTVDAGKAKVLSDRRLQIPRKAVEVLLHSTGQPLRGGLPVHVAITAEEAVVALNPFLGSTPHAVNQTRGRVHFASTTSTQFVPGTTYEIKATSAGLVITL
jgi:hypothetical protein